MIVQKPIKYWTEALEKLGVPSGPVNDIQEVFEDPHIRDRKMKIEMPHALRADPPVNLIGNPIRFSKTPVSYRHAPPTLGQQTDKILSDLLGLSATELDSLRKKGII